MSAAGRDPTGPGISGDAGLEAFRQRYRRDDVLEYTPEESRLLQKMEACINCGICLGVCEVLRTLGEAGAKSSARKAEPKAGPRQEFAGPRSLATCLSRSVVEHWAASDTIYYCTMCAACEAVCPAQVPIPEIVAMIRAKVNLQRPALVPLAHQALYENLNASGSIYGQAQEPFNVTGPRPEYVVFVGCVGSYLERQSVSQALDLLGRLGVRFTTIQEVCCGGPLEVTGMPAIEWIVERNLETILAAGTNRVLTSCPRCFLTLSRGPGYAGKLEVQHLAGFLAGFDWQPATEEAVTYHDPCEFGRHRGEYDGVRSVLHGAMPGYREMPRSREMGACCGAGGGLRGPHARLSRDVARGRLEEAMQTGARVLVTECNSCLHNFQNARRSKDNLEIYSLAEYLNYLLQGKNNPGLRGAGGMGG